MIELQEGEYGVTLVLTVTDADGDTHTFAGTETVQAYAKPSGGTAFAFGSSEVYDTDGIIHTLVQEADVANLVQGKYELRLKITGSSSVLIPEPAELSVGRGVG